MSPTPFKITFDFCTEGNDNVWQSHGDLVKEAKLETGNVHCVEYMGDAPNGWPMLTITFDCIETAKEYTLIYLGLGPVNKTWSIDDQDEVNEYISYGEFVGK